MGAELVTDPEFDDPSAWTISPTLDASVTGGQLVINSAFATGRVEPAVSPGMQFGSTYYYEIVVSSDSGIGSGITVSIGGEPRWGTGSGTGTFTGAFTLESQEPVPNFGYQLFIDYQGGAATFDRISIKMAHVRTQLRNQAVTELSVLAPGTVTGVVSTRLSPLRYDQSQLPYINVYTDDEESEPQTLSNNRKVERVLSLTTEIYLTGSETAIDAQEHEHRPRKGQASLDHSDLPLDD